MDTWYLLMICIKIALTQVIVYKVLSGRKSERLMTVCMALLMFIHYMFIGSNQLGEEALGFILGVILAPAFIIAVLLTIHDKKFKLRFLKLGFQIQIIYLISDTIALAFAKIFPNSLLKLIYYFSTILFALLFAFLAKTLADMIKKLPLKNKGLLTICILNIIVCLIVFIILFLALNYYQVTRTPIFVISLLIFLWVISASVLSLLLYNKYVSEKYISIMKKEELENLTKYAAIIEETYGQLRGLKHDFNNIMQSISISNEKDVKDELQNAMEEMIKSTSIVSLPENLAAIENIPVKAIVSSKLIHYVNQKMNVCLEVVEKAQYFYMDNFDLVRILGILLDNAFEEAELTEEKYIRVGILQIQGGIVIFIENSCREETPITNIMVESNFSTKGSNRGIGLVNFKAIIDTYDNCSYKMGINDNNLFFVKLKLLEN